MLGLSDFMKVVVGISDYLREYFDPMLEAVSQLRYLTPVSARVALLLISVAVVVIVITAWLHVSRAGPKYVVWASFCIPLFTSVLLFSHDAYQGVPDSRCHKYGQGNLTFVLLFQNVVPTNSREPLGPRTLLLLVRNEKRWGQAVHLCVLPLAHPKAQTLVKSFIKLGWNTTETNGNGVVTFTFGGQYEVPNVTWRPNGSPDVEKLGPPEKPPQGV